MNKILVLLFVSSLVLTACKDEQIDPLPPEPKTKTDLLTDAAWEIEEGTISPSIKVEVAQGQSITVSNYWDLLAFAGGGNVQDCDKNNRMICKRDSSVVLDEGPSKCDPGDPQTTDGGKWFFQENETKINFSSFPMDPTGEPRVLRIDLLNETTMTLTMTYQFKNPIGGGTTNHDIILKYKNVK